MLSNKLSWVWTFAVAAASSHLHAQNLPDTTACPKNVETIATCYSARLPTGAYVLAAMPKTWNGDLVVFAHGGPHKIGRAHV